MAVENQTTGDVEILEWEDPSAPPPAVAPVGKTRVIRDSVSGRLFISISTSPYVLLPNLPAISLADVAGGTLLPLLVVVPVPWDTTRFVDAVEFAHVPPSPLITIVRGGRFKISFNVTPTMTAGAGGGARTTVLHALLVNGAVAAGTNFVFSYHRIAADGTQTATLSPIELPLIAGDVVSVVSVKLTAGGTLVLSGGASSLYIERVA